MTAVAIVEPLQFSVCAREPETKSLETDAAEKVMERLLLGPIEACDAGEKPIVCGLGFHGLIETVHTAFANHYGLELSPDDIWVTIAQGLASVVAREPQTHAARLLAAAANTRIQISSHANFLPGSPTNDWIRCLEEFNQLFARYIGVQSHAHLMSNFTTTGVIERAASTVSLSHSAGSCFEYDAKTLCGIPFVKLHGSVADWRSVAQKVDELAIYGELGWWLDDVKKILAQIVSSAEGQPSKDFWNSIYKSRSESGGIRMTGWLLKLLPLVKHLGDFRRNPLLGHPDARPHIPGRIDIVFRDIPDMKSDKVITSSVLPSALSAVPFVWNQFGKAHKYQFVAGIIGFTQNAVDGALKPQMGWAVRPEPKVSAAAPNA
jgi:hypothetical protein